ncbi:MAG: hypothetical protein CVU24_18325, partial [Betaproteobacteria bacterium HGW-Betaproteobacteria-18]
MMRAGFTHAGFTALLLLAGAVNAQDRFVPLLDDPAARLPASPAHAATAAAPQVLAGQSPTTLDYARNADIDRLVVEVAANNRPA